MNSRFSHQQIHEIIESYNNGNSADIIAKHFSCCSNTILHLLRKNNISIRGKGGYRKPFNEDYFHIIDTEEKAYFLGFLMADGCVKHRQCSQPSIELTLNRKDLEILERFHAALGTTNKIYSTSTREDMWVRVHSQQMADDLKVYGVVPRKTGYERFPQDKIPQILHRHFIRGFFDGDGWVTLTTSHGKPNRRIAIGFCGNKDMLNDIKMYFVNHLPNITNVSVYVYNNSSVKIHGYDGFANLTFSKAANVRDIRDFMYKDATIYLKRKYDVFEKAAPLLMSSGDKSISLCNA